LIYNIEIYIALSLNNYYGKMSISLFYCNKIEWLLLISYTYIWICHMFCVIRYYYYMAKTNCRRNYRMKSLHFETRSNIFKIKGRFRLNLLLFMHCTLLSSAKMKQYFNRSVDSNTVDLFLENIGFTSVAIQNMYGQKFFRLWVHMLCLLKT
jgi:hypothetical protein